MTNDKFEVGDTVYVLDAKERNGTKISIVEKIFNAYTNTTYQKASLKDEDSDLTLIVNSWAIFKSEEDASKFAIIHLINSKEPDISINNEMNLSDQYQLVENEHAELILKYMGNIINL